MNGQRLIVASIAALLCSGVLTWQLNRHNSQRPLPVQHVATRTILVAARDLKAGDKIATDSLRTARIPASAVLQGLVSNSQEFLGHSLLIPLSAGEPLLLHAVDATKQHSADPEWVPVGMRLICVPAAGQTAADTALLKSGSHVDILVSYQDSAGSGYVSSLVLQDVAVRAPASPGNPGMASGVTGPDQMRLLVTPKEAAELAVAASLGKLTFAVRNEADTTPVVGLWHVTLAKTGDQPALPPQGVARFTSHKQAPIEHAFTVETLAGGKSYSQTFQDSRP